MQQFDRRCVVQIGQPGEQGLSWSGLRVSFTVRQTGSKNPNEATITIYGLSEASLIAAREDGAAVRLLCSYGDAAPQQVFYGDIQETRTERTGADTILHISAADGGRRFRQARISKTYSAGRLIRDLVQECLIAYGLPVAHVGQLPDTRLAEAVTLDGFVRDVLPPLLAALGAEYTSEDGEVVVLADGQEQPIERPPLSPRNGLIGSVEQTKDGWEVTALLRPQMRPGIRFAIESRDLSGLVKAAEVFHDGDTHGMAWHTKMVVVEA